MGAIDGVCACPRVGPSGPSRSVLSRNTSSPVNVSGLSTGGYSTDVTISGNADNAPLTIPVQLIISSVAYYPLAGKALEGTTPLAGVVISITGDSILSLVTAGDGSFAIGGLRAGTYVLTASHPSYSFTPASYTLAPLAGPRLDLFFYAQAQHGSAKLHYSKGWNLLSLPVDPDVHDIATLLPDASPATAYRYSPDSGYIAVTGLNFGEGYWIKCSRSDSVSIPGAVRSSSTVTLTARGGGWNLIGGASAAVPFSSILQTPASSVITMYQYDPGAGYRLPAGDLLRPGLGFFIKVRRDATLGLISSFTTSQQQLDDLRAPSTLPDILGVDGPPSFPGGK